MRKCFLLPFLIFLFLMQGVLPAEASVSAEEGKRLRQLLQGRIAAAPFCTMALDAEGNVLFAGRDDPHEEGSVRFHLPIRQIALGSSWRAFLLENGEVKTPGERAEDLFADYDPEDIVMITSNNAGLFAVQKDGSVQCLLSVGNSTQYKKIIQWKDMISLSSARTHVLGLRRDGTVVSEANISSNKIANGVAKWTDIAQISAGPYSAIGIRKDGTVVACGLYVSLKPDAAQQPQEEEFDFIGWQEEDIVQVIAGENFFAGLRRDGTVCIGGWQEGYGSLHQVVGWEDIVYISGNHDHIVGVKKDGTTVSWGNNDNGQRILDHWKLF